MEPGAINDLLKYLTLAGHLAVLVRLWHADLLREHRWFALYLAVVSSRFLALMLLPNGTRLYGSVYFLSLIPVALLLILVVNEVCNLVLDKHEGLQKLGRRIIVGALISGILIAGLLSGIGTQEGAAHPLLEQLLVLERSIMLALSVFLLAIAMFLSYFPLTLGRNTLVHTAIFSTFFLARTGVLWVRNAIGSSSDTATNLFSGVIAVLCAIGWLTLLRRRDEDKAVKVGVRFSPADEARVLGQLQALNRTLIGSTRE